MNRQGRYPFPFVILLVGAFMAACGPTAAAPPTAPPTAIPTATSSPTATPEPSPTPEPTATPFPTWPNDFQLGVNAQDFTTYSDGLLASGITWVSGQISIEFAEDAQTSVLIESPHTNGLHVLLTVTGDPENRYESSQQAEYVAAMAELARQGADAIEVLSEPNLDRSMAVVDPVQYTDLLCAAYAAIKRANPETLVISGAPAPTGYFGGCTARGCDDDAWLQGLAEAGAADCMDRVGVHFTSGATAPDEITGHPSVVASGIDHYSFYFEPMVEIYSESFDGEIPLAFTRLGYLSGERYEQRCSAELPDSVTYGANTTADDQTAWTVETVRMAAESDEIAMIFLFNLDWRTSSSCGVDPLLGWTMLQPDGSCPICEALEAALIQP